MSTDQGADDGGHGLDHLLGHGGERLVPAPVWVSDVRQIRDERGLEATTGRGLLGDLTDPRPRIPWRDRGTEPVDPVDEIGEVAEGEHPTQHLRRHQGHLAAVSAGSGAVSYTHLRA